MSKHVPTLVNEMIMSVAETLTEHKYGMPPRVFAQELGKIEDLRRFLYTIKRCAEKDPGAFDRALEMLVP